MAITSHDCAQQPESRRDTFSFTLFIEGATELSDDLERQIYDGGCDDALLGICDGKVFLDFDREAETLVDAIKSAIRDVEATPLKLRVVRVVPPGDKIIEMVNRVLEVRRNSPEIKSMGLLNLLELF